MSDVVVITGASGGIGRATARRFGRTARRSRCWRAGAPGSRRREGGRGGGGKALVLPTDVADADQVEAAAQAVEEALGPIDIWVNDAMATIYAEFLDIEPDEYRRATEVTYHGMVWGTRAALKRMVERNRGTIVQVCSAMSYRGIPLQAPYCGAKAACKNFTESVITEIRHHGWNVHISMVQLAGFNTTQFTWGRTKLPKQTQPVPPFYQPEVAADAIHWAAYHKRRQIFVGHADGAEHPRRARRAVDPRLVPREDGLRLADDGASRSTATPGTTTCSTRSTRTAGRTGPSTSRRTRTASRRRSRSTGAWPAASRPASAPRLRAPRSSSSASVGGGSEQLGPGRAEGVRILPRAPHAAPSPRCGRGRLPGLERAAEEEGEVAVPGRDARLRCRIRGQPAHDFARHRNLAVQVDRDLLRCHGPCDASAAESVIARGSARAERVDASTSPRGTASSRRSRPA